MNTLFWMHDDCLTPPPCDAIFIFDDDRLRAAGWGLKRLLFVYECLLELPVEILHGPTTAILKSLNRPLVTVDSPDPSLRQIMTDLHIEVIPAPAFVNLPESVDLKRFSRYWKEAERVLLDL